MLLLRSTQIDHIARLLEDWNQPRTLRIVNETQCIRSSYIITQIGLKRKFVMRQPRHQLKCLACLIDKCLINKFVSLPPKSQIAHTKATCTKKHKFACSKIPLRKWWKCLIFFPCTGSQGNSICIENKQLIQLRPHLTDDLSLQCKHNLCADTDVKWIIE